MYIIKTHDDKFINISNKLVKDIKKSRKFAHQDIAEYKIQHFGLKAKVMWLDEITQELQDVKQ